MRLCNLYISAIVFFCLFSSCGHYRLRQQMKSFMERQIVLPTEMIKITEGHTVSAVIASDKPELVIFHGKDECSSCAINHLYDDLPGLKEIAENRNCEVVLLFSPAQEDILEVQEQIRDLKFPFPIYLDLYGDFYRLNEDFPADARFHSFLIGKDGHPVFIGNPLHGSALQEVFENTLRKIAE